MSEPWRDDETIWMKDAPDIYYSAKDDVYYFSDEAHLLNGPYDTQKEAEDALTLYTRNL
jgi:hypothetical protein